MSYFDDVTNTGLSYNPYLNWWYIPPIPGSLAELSEDFRLSEIRESDMVAWKKAWVLDENPLNEDSVLRFYSDGSPFYERNVIVKLIIPYDAIVTFTPTKCRASRAKVEGIYPCWQCSPDNIPTIPTKDEVAHSLFDFNFKYVVGETAVPDGFNRNPRKICSRGIHFFRTYQEAAAYEY